MRWAVVLVLVAVIAAPASAEPVRTPRLLLFRGYFEPSLLGGTVGVRIRGAAGFVVRKSDDPAAWRLRVGVTADTPFAYGDAAAGGEVEWGRERLGLRVGFTNSETDVITRGIGPDPIPWTPPIPLPS